MSNIQTVHESLNSNSKINENVKLELERLVSAFNKQFPDVSLDNLCEKLSDLTVLCGSKYFYGDAIQYIPDGNTVVINQELLKSEKTDASHCMMKTLLSIITSKDNSYGFGNNRSLEALNVGFCEIVANNLVGNDGISNYEDEQILVNSIGSSIGFDVFANSFFTNNPNLLMTQLLSRCGDVNKLESFLSQVNNNMHTRKQLGISRLYFLQKNSDMLFQSGYDFMIGKKAMEESGYKYPGIEEIEQTLKKEESVSIKR